MPLLAAEWRATMETSKINGMKTSDILIVDDVAANLAILVQMLQKSGYGIRAVTSVRQAEQAIVVSKPHLILLDIAMPEIDGFEFCEMLKKNPYTNEIPIIFISAMNSPEDKIKGFKLGAVDFITKPFELEEVTVRVNTHLKIYRMNQEMDTYNKRLRMLVKEQRLKIMLEHRNLVHAIEKSLVYNNEVLKNHNMAAGKNARLLALGLQLSPIFEKAITDDFIDVIELASRLHDIGRFASVMEVVGTRRQKEEIISHTNNGLKLLKDILIDNEENEYIKMALPIAYSHHEKWDGTGLPQGLKGDDIPLPARIFSVVNEYDVLRKGIYGNKLIKDEAVSAIEAEAGKSFDPDIVSVFCRLQKRLKE